MPPADSSSPPIGPLVVEHTAGKLSSPTSPSVFMMESSIPLAAAVIAAPILKLCSQYFD